MSQNPFLTRSTLPYEIPPFSQITEDHYLEAFYAGTAEQISEVKAILANPEITFENTIVALEKSGQTLDRMLNVFYNKSSSDTNDRIDEIKAEIAPKLAAHADAIRLNPALFARIKKLVDLKPDLDSESDWLLQRYYKDFLQAGAALDESAREKVKKVNEELSSLETQFGKNLLSDTNDLAVFVDDISELDGLSENQIAACKAAAQARGIEDKWMIGMVNFTGHPTLASLKNRPLRERIMKNSLTKGMRGNDFDTRKILLRMAELRAERAKLFGLGSHAEYVLQEMTAAHPDRVHEMLRKIAPAAATNARREAADIEKVITQNGKHELASWDWLFYTEKVRAEKYNLDTAAMRPYFELERVLHQGVFFAAEKLYGMKFKERKDLITYHPEARAFEVFNEDGSSIGLYIGDYYTRDSKRGGAWMNSLVAQNHLLGQKPVVVNNMNISKPPAGEPTLLTYDETTTLFHEFGHAIHGLLSDVKYPRFSGTSVQRDFVEFPSQVNEMWILWPEVLDNYAIHYQTGERLPQAWVDKLNESSTFNEGYATTSYLAAAILDLAWHSLADVSEIRDVEEFEAKAIADYGLDFPPVPTRYRSTYFSHIFAGGYSAGYYGYIWSEVLDADTVEWFKNNGGLTRANGDHFRNSLMSRGGSLDSMQMFRNFRGRDADIEPLLRRRGLK
ncbi:MAG: M3 family metallopeptidase [Actinobacteria bacterium]|nr:M3 family metallopeptidase [Actinomycetota bacterium]